MFLRCFPHSDTHTHTHTQTQTDTDTDTDTQTHTHTHTHTHDTNWQLLFLLLVFRPNPLCFICFPHAHTQNGQLCKSLSFLLLSCFPPTPSAQCVLLSLILLVFHTHK